MSCGCVDVGDCHHSLDSSGREGDDGGLSEVELEAVGPHLVLHYRHGEVRCRRHSFNVHFRYGNERIIYIGDSAGVWAVSLIMRSLVPVTHMEDCGEVSGVDCIEDTGADGALDYRAGGVGGRLRSESLNLHHLTAVV